MAEAKKRQEVNVRGRWWVRAIQAKAIVVKSMSNFELRRDQINYNKWRLEACHRIRRNFMLTMRRFGPSIDLRQTTFIRHMFSFYGVTHVPATKYHPKQALYTYLKEAADVEVSIKKFRAFYARIYAMKSRSLKSRSIMHSKQDAILA